jgi:tetratricopeptide (TPR) repeat protein
LDWLSNLVDKSLITVMHWEQGDVARYRLLEPIRQYALEKLVEAREAEVTRARHLQFFVELAEPLSKDTERVSMDRFATEHDNLRAALTWSFQAGPLESGLRLATAMMNFWSMRGYQSERYRFFETALALTDEREPSLRLTALIGIGISAQDLGDFEAARSFFEEGLALAQQVGDKRSSAEFLINLGITPMLQGELKRARPFLEQSLALGQELNDKQLIRAALRSLGIVEGELDLATADRMYSEALNIDRELGDSGSMSMTLAGKGLLATQQGEFAAAQTFLNQSLQLARELGSKALIAMSVTWSGYLARVQGEPERAIVLCKEGLTLEKEMELKLPILDCLQTIAGIACDQNEFERATRLYGASVALRQAQHIKNYFDIQDRVERDMTALESNLGEDRFTVSWAEGRRLTLDQAVEYALNGHS